MIVLNIKHNPCLSAQWDPGTVVDSVARGGTSEGKDTTPAAAGLAGGPILTLSSLPALQALLDRELSLVITVTEALLWDSPLPPVVCLLPTEKRPFG